MTQPQPEGLIARRVIDLILNLGGVAVKTHPAQARRGLPDIIGSVPPHGRTVAFEVKRPDTRGRATTAQRMWLDRYSDTGAITGVVTSPREALELITHHNSRPPADKPQDHKDRTQR